MSVWVQLLADPSNYDFMFMEVKQQNCKRNTSGLGCNKSDTVKISFVNEHCYNFIVFEVEHKNLVSVLRIYNEYCYVLIRSFKLPLPWSQNTIYRYTVVVTDDPNIKYTSDKLLQRSIMCMKLEEKNVPNIYKEFSRNIFLFQLLLLKTNQKMSYYNNSFSADLFNKPNVEQHTIAELSQSTTIHNCLCNYPNIATSFRQKSIPVCLYLSFLEYCKYTIIYFISNECLLKNILLCLYNGISIFAGCDLLSESSESDSPPDKIDDFILAQELITECPHLKCKRNITILVSHPIIHNNIKIHALYDADFRLTLRPLLVRVHFIRTKNDFCSPMSLLLGRKDERTHKSIIISPSAVVINTMPSNALLHIPLMFGGQSFSSVD
ncbi:hypothetical protein AGLY_007724, partial [Aphis glycines]